MPFQNFRLQSPARRSHVLRPLLRFLVAAPALLGAGLCLGFAPALAAAAPGSGGMLPVGLRTSFYKTLVGTAPSGAGVAKSGCASLGTRGLKACFDRREVRFMLPGGHPLSLRLAAVGRGARLAPAGTATRAIAGNRVSYRYSALTEWWRVLPMGYEQGFTLRKRTAGSGPLTLVLAAGRSPRRYDGNLGWGRLRYGGLVVTDARDRRVPAMLAARGSRIEITVDDREARYPLTVDPLVWVRQIVNAPAPVTSSGTAAAPAAATTTASAFGADVLLSGETAFVGAPYTVVAGNAQQGAVFVYTEASDRTWNESAMLTAGDGAPYDQFGSALAVSGNNLLIGAPGASVGGNSAQGAVYVFASAAGTWNQAQKLTASDGAAGDEFGGALAISGTTALIGARTAAVGGNSRAGAAYAFDDVNGTWGQAQKLTASDAAAGNLFGSAVALDGSMALVGAPAASVDGESFRGAAYAFDNVGGAWSQAQKLTASDGASSDQFGSALALEGTTALVGAPYADVSGTVNQGKVYVFTASGGLWSQGPILTASDGASNDQFGSALALGGPYALVGGQGDGGNAYLYNDMGGDWTQTMEFNGGLPGFGRGVALEGLTALVGSPNTSAGSGGGLVVFYTDTNLSLTMSAPSEVTVKAALSDDMVLTNSAATDSPPLTLITFVPTGATYVSASTTQGKCTRGVEIDCDLGQVAGNSGAAHVNVTFQVTTAKPSTTVSSLAVVQSAAPTLTAGAATVVKAKPSSGGGALGPWLLVLLGLLAAAAIRRRRTARVGD